MTATIGQRRIPLDRTTRHRIPILADAGDDDLWGAGLSRAIEVLRVVAGDAARYTDPEYDYQRGICEEFALPMADSLECAARDRKSVVVLRF